ncbi:multidrug efflux RND transporter permease subunit [Pelistega europaea]|uniref:Efflux pump membrane transporter n=1 Tax=Pelistega europaea TaxID=106147 RepID=A0A7Y4L8G5_9BURK|nr:multidrug efflux RND transporter permease subunit [Pelistega europaea]NOL48920.1 multidrug efflux RND transporter permease subunit [Pelistega europaea]
MAQFFIHRPIFAWVIAILITLFGALALPNMPIAQYPNVAPPTISINASYPGASPEEVARSVTSIIENKLNGIENLLYYTSTSDANGNAQIDVTFEAGTNDDQAQIDVQNAVASVTASLPTQVTQQGLTYNKQNSGFLLIVALSSKDSSYSAEDLSDYIVRNIQNPISRVKGVGKFQLFGAERAMRIWVDPQKLTAYDLTMADVNNAISAQHGMISAGVLGGPPTPDSQTISAIIRSNGELTTVDDFNNVVLKSDSNGALVYLKDVARVEIGIDSYRASSRLNGKPTAVFAISLSPTANALETEGLIKEEMDKLSAYFPEGVTYTIPYNTAPYIDASINKVFHTLLEAMVLVFIVMFIFLQNIRYTLIPSLVVPVALMGTVAALLALGYSINVLTMFAMVLAIGILVDDAIVVVENVERIMATEGLPPKQATIKAMPQISGAIVGITLVLITVFTPLLFMSGSSGVIYRQFAVAMAVSIAFSGFLALTFTPALCATILKAIPKGHHIEKKGFFGWFNRSFDKVTLRYSEGVAALIKRSVRMMIIYVLLVAGAVFLFKNLPSSFMPEEDQGFTITSIELPSGVSTNRTVDVLKQVEGFYMNKVPELQNIIAVQGFSFNGSGLNSGIAFATLKGFEERKSPESSASAIAGKATGALLYGIPDATIFSIIPPSIPGLGTSSGFSLELQDRDNLGQAGLRQAAQLLIQKAGESGKVVNARIAGLGPGPQLSIKVNRDKAQTFGVAIADVRSVLSTAVGSNFIGKFPNNGRMQNIWVQADDNGRLTLDEVLKLKVRNSAGNLVDLSSLVDVSWTSGPSQVKRFNSYDSISISGDAAPGFASSDAMNAMVDIIKNDLPKGIGYEWSGISYQEIQAGNQAPIMMALAILVVFLVLAALYESWSIPLSALLIVPLGMLGTVALTKILNMSNDIYFQVGMITVIGLSAKNAILIVEFAKDAYAEGKDLFSSAVEAARLRFRPILMTSFAFIMGVIPLAMATGEGAAGQKAVGFGVLGGMLAATPFSVTFVPVFFVFVLRLFKTKPRLLGPQETRHEEEVKERQTKNEIYADLNEYTESSSKDKK